jgi:cytochrome c5
MRCAKGAQWRFFLENDMTFKGFLSVCAALAFSSAEAATDPVYQQVCSVCHAAGVAGAPKVGDTKKWAPLIAEGQVILTAHGYVGIRAMPAKGGKPDLSLKDFAGALVHMVNQSGGKWTAPNAALLGQMEKEVVKREQQLKAKK